jgi:hypothetical protein
MPLAYFFPPSRLLVLNLDVYLKSLIAYTFAK